MGLISRVSSRTYRKKRPIFAIKMSAYKYKLNSTQSCHYKLKPNTNPHPYDCKIIDRKKAENQNGNLYKIHWVGWKAKFDLWVPEEIINSKMHFTDSKGETGSWENNNKKP